MAKFEARLLGYSTAGFDITTLVVYADTPEELAGALHGLKLAGITPEKPDASEISGEKSEIITCVVKRMHVSKSNQETPVVDFYPSWQGEYGQYRFVGVYLNTAEQMAEFEQHSGLQLAHMPIYESQTPLQRNPARRHSSEVACHGFLARKMPDGMKEIDGKSQQTWKFAGYAEAAPSNTQPVHPPAGNGLTPKAPVWWTPVINAVKNLPHFGGQPKHAINALNKMIADGEVMESWTFGQVIEAVKAKYDVDEAPARDTEDIPF